MAADGAFRCITLSDFTLDNFNAFLAKHGIEPVETPYGLLHQTLHDAHAPCWLGSPDAAFIWTQPQAVAPSFARVLNHEPTDHEVVLAEVDEYVQSVTELSDRVEHVFHATWTMAPYERGLGLLDMQNGVGVANLIARMNLRLCDHFSPMNGFFVLDAGRWLTAAGRANPPKSWYMAKLPFANGVFKEAALDLQAAAGGLRGHTKKLVIVDLDDTLWGGIVGEVGAEGLTLGGHDPSGEAFVDFQTALKSLTRRGVLLGIVSKNDERPALNAIEQHPEMILGLNDFAGWRINWQDKARNIVELVEELNLGLQSVAFIDDNPAERARVAEALPEVLVPEWPRDPTLYRKALLEMRCFDTPTLSDEDRERSGLYAVERQRKTLKQEAQSLDQWLTSLETKLVFEELNDVNLPRAAQLFNKTNQLNLSTRRLSERLLQEWAQADNRRLWSIRVSDRFSNLGLTGIISLECDGDVAWIVDFILSCRVMGRMVEEAMVGLAFRHAQSLGLREVAARFVHTKKNRPCWDFWERSAFQQDAEEPDLFRLSTDACYPLPSHIEYSGAAVDLS